MILMYWISLNSFLAFKIIIYIKLLLHQIWMTEFKKKDIFEVCSSNENLISKENAIDLNDFSRGNITFRLGIQLLVAQLY